jgi:hypothetical protein
MPAVKLLIERCPEPSHQVSRFAPPLARLGASGIELLGQLVRLLLDRSRSSEDVDEAVSHDDRAQQTREQDPPFSRDMREGGASLQIDPNIDCGEQGNGQKAKQNPDDESTLGGEGRARPRRHPLHVAHPMTKSLKSFAYHI